MIGLTTLHGLLGQGENVTPTSIYGRLYNWHAASDADFAPTDWKVPTETEFNTLISAITDGGDLKESGLDHWKTPNTGADNSSGFTAFGGGGRGSGGAFSTIKEVAGFWSTTIDSSITARYLYLLYNYVVTGMTTSNRSFGYSAKLLYDGIGTPPATITDYEGRVYDVVQIGTQYWTVQNWACKYLNDGTEIPIVTDNTEWAALTTLACCAYDNDESKV